MTVRSGNFQILDSKDIKSLRTIREISSGASGRVLEVGKEEKLALKVMHVGESTISSFKEFIGEYEKLCHLNHPNILRAFGIFLSDEQNPPSILLELCEQNLSTAIKKSSPTQVEIILWIYQISEAMKYVHKNSLIHRDLKPTNILIGKDSKIRIGDFGISKLMTSEEQSTILGSGTQKFMAPELLKEEKYDEKVDVYSFGVVVFFLLSGGQMPKINIIQVGNGKKAKIPDSFSTFAKELINNCWNYKPKERPSFESILSILEKNDYELFELSKSEKNEIRSFVKNHKKLISDYNDQSKKIDLVQKKVDDDENRPIISPVFSSAVSKFSSNDQFAILCSLLIQNASSLITDPQSTLLCKNFNKDSDLVTILDSICEMSEKYPKKNINSGFNLLTVDSIYQTIKPESVVKAVKWSRKTKEGTFGMVEKFINLLDNEFIEKRKCEFVHIINARPESVPELVYKTKDRKKVHIYQRPGSLGLQCPGNVIVLSMSPNEKNNEIYYGMIIHNQNKEKTDIKQGVVSSEFLYNKFYFPLFENYTFNLFNSTNIIEMYQTTEPNKRYSLFVYIDHNKGYLSYCPRSEKIYKSIKNSLEFLNSLLPFVPRSIISKLDNPNCVVEINGYGSSNNFTTSIHLEKDLPSAYPLNKKALEFAAKNIIDLRKDVPSIRFAITGESLIYKNANNIDDDFELEIPIPDASLSIQSVFDPNHPSHLILLVDKKYKNKPDIKPLSWIYKAENHEIYKFKWNLDKLANPEILAKNLEEDTTCTFICEPPRIYLPQPIYAYQKDGSVKTLSICKKCLIEYFKNIEDIQNSIDSVNKKFKFNKSIKLNVIMPGLPFASDESDKKGITWPQIPIGQGIFAILSDIKEFGVYIKTWLTLIIKISYEKTIKLTHCPNHPDVFYEKPESGINIKCPKCDMFLCASCNSWHKMSDKCSSELNGIKKCPNCGTPSYKVSGSNKISCPCGKHWCYKCNKSEIYQTPDEVYKHLQCVHGGYWD